MYLPININLTNKTCLVVGAGNVALKKIELLLLFGAKIKVVAPIAAEKVRLLAKKNKITLISRNFKPADLKNIHLLISATSNRALNKKISVLSAKNNIPANIVDDPGLCSFIMPAVIKRGDLVISISTSGKAPAFSKALRAALEKIITPDFKNIVDSLGRARACRRIGTGSLAREEIKKERRK